MIVPLVELTVILQVAGVIGTPWTIALLVVDSLIGAWLLKREGRRAWQQFRRALDELRWPGDEVAQGALVLVGGTLLLTPGFVTDVVGFLFLLPPTRRVVAAQVRRRIRPLGGAFGRQDTGAGPRRRERAGRGEVLDVEVVEIERDEPDVGSGGAGRRDGGSSDGRRRGELPPDDAS
ncbi:hypothetical protein GCM10011354_30900 [Egicoccus halophilus]|uniref:Uncharacterized protein n=1 Tax=Egicoccus halophilus TaxID=1670830 RepID=A0A8J3EVB4_9ACTN|nr:hypothetical protein GCM10011354_30900 [Egicoccus halophilus]